MLIVDDLTARPVRLEFYEEQAPFLKGGVVQRRLLVLTKSR